MESKTGKTGRYKAKNKKTPAKLKTPKKKKTDGPTCSLFLAELTKKFLSKKRQEDQETEPVTNIVNTIIDTIANALPIIVSKRTIARDSPMKMETLQSMAPELLPNDIVEIRPPLDEIVLMDVDAMEGSQASVGMKIPRMPIILSDIMKPPVRKLPVVTADIAVNTGGDHDVASEIAKHVGTLRKISLIAEEFNQKTAKNLKEIVDSVQEDLIKKLEEIKAEQKAREEQQMMREAQTEQIA